MEKDKNESIELDNKIREIMFKEFKELYNSVKNKDKQEDTPASFLEGGFGRIADQLINNLPAVLQFLSSYAQNNKTTEINKPFIEDTPLSYKLKASGVSPSVYKKYQKIKGGNNTHVKTDQNIYKKPYYQYQNAPNIQ